MSRVLARQSNGSGRCSVCHLGGVLSLAATTLSSDVVSGWWSLRSGHCSAAGFVAFAVGGVVAATRVGPGIS